MPPNTQRKKLILAGIIVVIIFLVIPITIFIIASQYSATLDVMIAPSFAKLIIDDKEYPIDGEFHFKPTQTKAIISADGFQTQEIDLSLLKDETTTLAIYLVPNDGDLSWYYDRPEEQSIFQTVGGIQATNQAEEFEEEHPISDILPYQTTDIIDNDIIIDYRIDIGAYEDCKTNFCLKITDYSPSGNGYNYAIDYIKSNGYDPDKYQIFYTQATPVYY